MPSKSPMASLVFFIKKKDGKLRLVQDYQRLNKITIKNQYPLPLAADIINSLTKAQYFTKFDVWWGHHNIHICEEDEWKGAIVTNRGLYEPKVMYFRIVKGFTPLCPTWAVVIWWRTCCDFALVSTRGIGQRGERKGSNKFRMNLVVIWRTPSWRLGVRTSRLLIHSARGHIGLCYRTNR